MARDTISVTEEEIQRALSGIMLQLGASGIARGFDSLEDAVEALDLGDFLRNQASVTAHHVAFHVMNDRIVNELTHSNKEV